MIVRELVLKTSRIFELGQFYRNLFGLEVVREELGIVSFRIGASLLTFEGVPDNDHPPFYHFAINIPSNQFEEAREWLSARTPLLLDMDGEDRFHFEAMGAEAVYFRDPGHNIGELIAREAIAPAPHGPFGPSQMISISEVGLPVRDVHTAAEQLTAQFGLSVYIPLTDLFGAVGDAEGMFILVREGRPWVPTLAPAGIHPMRVVLKGDAGMELELDEHPYSIKTSF